MIIGCILSEGGGGGGGIGISNEAGSSVLM